MQKISFAQIDLYLFNLINGYVKKSRLLAFFGIFCAIYLPWILIIWLSVCAYINGNWKLLLIPVAAGLFSLVLNEIIYLFYKRKRPREASSVNALISKPFSPAFPSSHASFFFALSFTLFLFSTPLVYVFIVLSALISLSRIFCGAHWPLDILAGLVTGLLS